MTLTTLISICKQYNDLGWSMQQQLAAIVDGDSLADQNANALRAIRDFLDSHVDGTNDAELSEEAQTLSGEITDYLNTPDGEEDDE